MRKSGRPRVACIYAHLDETELFDRVQFYARDIQLLERLGFEVVRARRWRDIPWNADLYFIWWWTWAFQPLIKAKVSRKPTVITGVLNADYRSDSFFDRPSVERWIMKWSMRTASLNVVLSELEMRSFSSHFPEAPVLYSPCVVDTEVYTPGTQQRHENLVLTIAWLGSENARRKAIFELVEAIPLVLQSNPDTAFAFVGTPGGATEELRARVDELGVTAAVDWMGPVSEGRKIELLQSCGTYLQPTHFEGFGLAILEAMSCGAPVITSPAGAVPEVVGNAALMCDAGSPESIAAAVIALRNDPDLARDLGVRARERARNEFSLDRRTRDLADRIAALVPT
jgi:glycosyltransferase involved in cell wall biosynthesis